MPFCRHSAVLRIEKSVFWSLREYTKVSRIIHGIFFDWLGVFEVKEWRAWRDLNSRHSEPESDALSGLSYRRIMGGNEIRG